MSLPVAQTNLQLWEQLAAAGWDEAYLRRAREAYEIAARLFAGRQRPSGKGFLAHLCGVASLAQQLGAPRNAVIAGLVHSAYTHGDFGLATTRARGLIGATLGAEVEAIVARYTASSWDLASLRDLRRRACGEGPPLAPEEREVLFLRVADALEDYLDLGEVYGQSGARDKGAIFGDAEDELVGAARVLGEDRLADELESAIRATRSARRPDVLRSRPAAPPPPGPRPRVLLFRDRAGLGGTEQLVLILARLLPWHGFDVQTILAGARAFEVADWFRRSGVHAEVWHEPARRGSLRRLLALRRVARASRADVVNIQVGGTTLPFVDVLAVRAAGRRCVASPHAIRPVSNPRRRRATRLAARLCTTVVVGTSVLHDRLLEIGIPARRLRRVDTGIPVPAATPDPKVARERLGIPPDAAVLACVARLDRVKGLDVLFAAAARIPDPTRRIRLVLAGDGPERSALAELAAELLPGRACFLGWVDDPTDVYAAADLLVLASRIEGAPLAIREAAMHGVPAVASDVGGVCCLVESGVNGLLVPPEDPEALGAALAALLDDPDRRACMGRAARDRARSEFAEEGMVRGYAAVLREASGDVFASPA